MPQVHKPAADFTEAQIRNFEEIECVAGYQRGEPMSFEQADHGRANESRDGSHCASCVVAHEMRLRGYDITARAYEDTQGSPTERLANDTLSAWLTDKGQRPQFTAELKADDKGLGKKLEKITGAVGSRYHISWDYELDGQECGHIITAERTKGAELVLYDPQINEFVNIKSITNKILYGLQILRVNKLLINPRVIVATTDTF